MSIVSRDAVARDALQRVIAVINGKSGGIGGLCKRDKSRLMGKVFLSPIHEFVPRGIPVAIPDGGVPVDAIISF